MNSSNIGAAFFCLLFAVPFGGVGLGASYVLGGTIVDGMKAKDWVKVKADVVTHHHPNVSYRYSFNDKQYTGDRMGSSIIGGTDNIDDWHPRMESMLDAAVAEKKPITVYVNPDDPSQSMIDRTIRWGFLLFLLPFSLAFGGVGVGALWMFQKVLRGGPGQAKPKPGAPPPQRASTHVGERRTPQRIKSDAGSNIVMLWVFTFFWNAISFPIAMLFVPQIIERKEWIGLFVLLFPMIGVMLVVAAIRGTIYFLKRGGVSMTLADDSPHVGGPLQGHIAFGRGVKTGDTFRIRLVCYADTGSGDNRSSMPVWTKEIDSRAADMGGEARLQFRFDVPSNLKPSGADGRHRYRWKVEARPPGSNVDMPYGFQVELGPAVGPVDAFAQEPDKFLGQDTFAADGSHVAAEPPKMTVASTPEMAQLEQMLARMGMPVDDVKRAQLNAMTPEARKMVVRAVQWGPKLKKVVFVGIGIFVAFQVLGFAISIYQAFQ